MDVSFVDLLTLAQLSDSPIDPALIALLGAQLLALLAKLMVLGWAYFKTKKPAAIAYAIYLLFQAVVPFLLPVLGPAVYGRYAILLALLEIFLFIWLIYSLVKSFRPPKPLSSDDI